MPQPAPRKAAYLSVCGKKERDSKYNKDKKEGMMEMNANCAPTLYR